MVSYRTCKSQKDFADAKNLFIEYATSLNFELCFQNFEKEISDLPAQYSEPTGCIIMCYENDRPIGCVGLRKFSDGICEMKRLYLKNEARRKGIGRTLTEKVIEKAKRYGYKKMQLDTIETMKEAISLYKSMGFREISAYRYNPVKGVIYMELELKSNYEL
jgi:ribosomal protein S18 acetylase RimI-like enzyme